MMSNNTHNPGKLVESAMEARDRELYRLTARFNSLMRNAFEAIIIITSKAMITEVNDAVTVMFGYTATQLNGKNMIELVDRRDRDELRRYLSLQLAGDESLRPAGPLEAKGLRHNGEVLPILLNLSCIDKTREWVVTIRDLTEHKALQKAVMEISAHEQRRLGSELHDSLGQQLTGISLIAKDLKCQLQADLSPQLAAVDEIIQQTSNAIGTIREIVHGLVPLSLTPESLPFALEKLLTSLRHTQVKFSFNYSRQLFIYDHVVALQILRIVQEACNNAIKHAQAQHVKIDITQMGSAGCRLTIKDDGKGFTYPLATDSGGKGLKLMLFRASAIGARLTIHSQVKKGTIITCQL